MKSYPMPTECPVTGGRLDVTRLECAESGVVIEGRFQPNEFALLPADQLDMLRLFVKVRGNLKELERVLGVSYPTVRLRFESLLQTLGYESLAEEKEHRDDILTRLEKGEISVEEATAQLKSMKAVKVKVSKG